MKRALIALLAAAAAMSLGLWTKVSAQDSATPAAATATATAAPAAAPTAPAAKPEPIYVGDAKSGRDLVYTCAGCHGIIGYKNAYPNYHVPRIAGQSVAYLTAALKAYQSGERPHPTMRAQARSFSDQDIADIALYLSTYKASK